jgi:hypothetical protein
VMGIRVLGWPMLVSHVCGHTEIAEEDGAIVVDEKIGSLDVTVDEAVDVQVAVEDKYSVRIRGECLLGEWAMTRVGKTTHWSPSRACLRMHFTTSSFIPPGHA